MNEPYIKLLKRIVDWQYFGDAHVLQLLIYLLATVNFKTEKWRGITIKAGQKITSIEKLANACECSKNTIQRCLKILVDSETIEMQSDNKKTIITMCNYSKFQRNMANSVSKNDMQSDTQPNTLIDTQVDTQSDINIRNKEYKKEKNINNSLGQKRNVFIPPTIEEVKEYCKERNNNVDADRFVNFYTMKGWIVGRNKMKDWKAAVRTWEGKPTTNALQTKKEKENLDVNRFWNTKN